MRGNITRRGKRSWRIKYDVERIAGARQIRYVTVKGTRKDAEAELAGARGQHRHQRRPLQSHCCRLAEKVASHSSSVTARGRDICRHRWAARLRYRHYPFAEVETCAHPRHQVDKT